MPRVALTLRSPAAIGDLPGSGFVRPSLSHVPGSVLRGAVAAAWLKAGRSVDETFLSAFERDVVWGPLYLPGSEPQPMSHWVHKYAPDKECPAFWDEASEEVPEGRRCPECDDPLEPSKGQVFNVRRTLDTHVQLADGRAVDGALFARERIDRGQMFVGSVHHLNGRGADSLNDVWLTLGCGREGTSGRIWVGGRRSTDGGRADLELKGDAGAVGRASNDRVVVCLLSPGIFVDDYGLPVGEPRSDEISEVLGVGAGVARSWVRWTTVGGWHAAARLPKPAERAVAAGSVFEIECVQAPDPARVTELFGRGLGLRRVEGYGALRPMPQRARSYAEIEVGVIALRALSPRMLQTVLDEVEGAESAIRGGGRPTWGLLTRLANSDKAGAHMSLAARFITALTSADELDVVVGVLREKR